MNSKRKITNTSSLTDRARFQESLELRRPSIERIITLGKECLEHDSSWYEFRDQCKELLVKEDKMVRMLSNKKT